MNLLLSKHSTVSNSILNDKFDLGGIILYILFLVILLYAVYFSTKFIAKTYSSVSGKHNVKLIEKCALSMDRAVYVIKLEDEYIYLYADRNNMSVLKCSKAVDVLEQDGIKSEGVLKRNGLVGKKFFDIINRKTQNLGDDMKMLESTESASDELLADEVDAK